MLGMKADSVRWLKHFTQYVDILSAGGLTPPPGTVKLHIKHVFRKLTVDMAQHIDITDLSSVLAWSFSIDFIVANGIA